MYMAAASWLRDIRTCRIVTYCFICIFQKHAFFSLDLNIHRRLAGERALAPGFNFVNQGAKTGGEIK